MWGATKRADAERDRLKFQSTHPVWGATKSWPKLLSHSSISIHAPRVGCDSQEEQPRFDHIIFQSTHPVWGATPRRSLGRWGPMDFNPRTPCGVRPQSRLLLHTGTEISIHAPRVGCDTGTAPHSTPTSQFQSTHPVWGATLAYKEVTDGDTKFQSTHPVWGATANLYKVRGESLCSLHRLHSINSKCYNCGGEKISTPHINWKNVCANLPGML